MTDRRTYLELLHGEIDAAAKEFARELFEGVAQGITVGLETEVEIVDQIAEMPDVPFHDVDALILPAYKAQVFKALATEAEAASVGWLDVFFTNLRERYENGGGIEV